MPPVELWAWAFLWTCALEIPAASLVLVRRMDAPQAVMVATAAQFLTHPALWYLAPRFEPYWAWVLVAECVVVAVEAALFWAALRWARVEARPAFLVACTASILANSLSVLVGMWLV